RRDWTAGDGSFRFPALEAGRYRLTVNGPQWGPARGEFSGAEPLELEVEAGRSLEGLRFELPPSLRIAGRVVDDRGQPVVGARVLVLPRDRPPLQSSRPRTDEEGRFVVRGLTRGVHDLTVTHSDYAETRIEGIELGDDDRGIVELGELEVVLARGVEVAVRARVDGLAAAGALARLTRVEADADERARAAGAAFSGLFDGRGIAGSDGRAELGRVLPGVYRLEVRRGMRELTLEAVEVVEGPPLTLDVDLR
ncbi:MAG: carboxypeptidase-like regulatory domain-containing protein, partial [Planctomycetota bacterium]